MGKRSNLKHSALKELKAEIKYGQSKHHDKVIARRNGTTVKGIYSTSTYKTYAKACCNFIDYCIYNHKHEIKNLKHCKSYVAEYLRHNENRGLSAWTIHMRAYAIASMFHCKASDFDYKLPVRSRANITRSRNIKEDTINNSRYERIREFCKATGARRGGLLRLTLEDIRYRENGGLEIHLREKNGMERWARVLPEKEEFVKEVFKNSQGHYINGEEKLFNKSDIPKNMELHSCRSVYATNLYKLYEREGFATGNMYYCRKDKLGLSYDKGILKEVSENLGHHRCDVVVSHYLYK